MQKKKIIRFAIVLIIFLVIFGIVFVINQLTNNQYEKYEEPEKEITPYNMESVTEYSYFFSIVNILNNYLSNLKNHNTESLLNVLHSEYLKEYKLNENNIYDNLVKLDSDSQYTFKVRKMDYKTYDELNRYLYYINGDIILNNFEDSEVFMENVKFLINVDYENLTYAIYPLSFLYEILPVINPQKEIIKNKDNGLIGSNVITKDYICNLYLSDFIRIVNNDLNKSYDLLESDFRRKNYAKKSSYIDYMNKNKSKLSSQIYSCNSLSAKNHVYEIKDMNFNTYTFTEESIMNYKVEFTIN